VKIYCDECGWTGTDDQILVWHFIEDPPNGVQVCPRCKEVGKFFRACDEPGCWLQVCAGTPTPEGYRTTCIHHMPKEGESFPVNP